MGKRKNRTGSIFAFHHCVIQHFRSQHKNSEPGFSNHPPRYVSGCGHGKQNGCIDIRVNERDRKPPFPAGNASCQYRIKLYGLLE